MNVKFIILILSMVGSMMNAEEKKYNSATFAGGCFWCMEPPFEKLDGVIDVVSGYTYGTNPNPTYKNYADSGHIEAIKVTYDPSKISYDNLLDVFWRQIDPTDGGGQFVDRGLQYRSAIFYHTKEQEQKAEASREALQNSGRFDKPIVTEILPARDFYPAEEYHQDYAEKNPIRYKFYRWNSGRDQFLQKHWTPQSKEKKTTFLKSANNKFDSKKYSKPSKEELKKILNPLQFKVTQQEGTEPPFNNAYWNNKQPGIYVDIVSGEPLFSSKDKFVSGTGWPSFTKPLVPENIVEREDRGWFTIRTEVRSKHGDSHLGHVFKDGPLPTGLRYCLNSAALRFIPAKDLEKEGYGQYIEHFK